MDISSLRKYVSAISEIIKRNRDYLVELDARNGDGDLGISMDAGFSAILEYLIKTDELDLGRALAKCSAVFNEAAPSTMGTIISFGLLGMAKSLKGNREAGYCDIVNGLEMGLLLIMDKAKSKPGEKTILDSLYPAVEVLKASESKSKIIAFNSAFIAAGKGMESTKAMKPVHGRSAYYGNQGIGQLDAGSVVGKLIFEGIVNVLSQEERSE